MFLTSVYIYNYIYAPAHKIYRGSLQVFLFFSILTSSPFSLPHSSAFLYTYNISIGMITRHDACSMQDLSCAFFGCLCRCPRGYVFFEYCSSFSKYGALPSTGETRNLGCNFFPVHCMHTCTYHPNPPRYCVSVS